MSWDSEYWDEAERRLDAVERKRPVGCLMFGAVFIFAYGVVSFVEDLWNFLT